MPTLYGATPEYGMKTEEGLLVESMDYQWTPDWYEQKGADGRKCGVKLVDEQIDVSMSGAVPLNDTHKLRGGALMSFANVVPDVWAETPQATTSYIGEVKVSKSNSDATKKDLTVHVMAYGQTGES